MEQVRLGTGTIRTTTTTTTGHRQRAVMVRSMARLVDGWRRRRRRRSAAEEVLLCVQQTSRTASIYSMRRIRFGCGVLRGLLAFANCSGGWVDCGWCESCGVFVCVCG